MPLYDYGCPSCGSEKEVHHSISEIGKIEVVCDTCGGKMNKLLSAPSLIGFDDVGRSVGKKDKTENTNKENTNSSTTTKSENSSKKDAA